MVLQCSIWLFPEFVATEASNVLSKTRDEDQGEKILCLLLYLIGADGRLLPDLVKTCPNISLQSLFLFHLITCENLHMYRGTVLHQLNSIAVRWAWAVGTVHHRTYLSWGHFVHYERPPPSEASYYARRTSPQMVQSRFRRCHIYRGNEPFIPSPSYNVLHSPCVG